MARGGYQIIDLKNKPIPFLKGPDGLIAFDGLFELIAHSSKPLYITNIVIENDGSLSKIPDFISSAYVDANYCAIVMPDLYTELYIHKQYGVCFRDLNIALRVAVSAPITVGTDGITLDIDETLTVDAETGKLGVATE